MSFLSAKTAKRSNFAQFRGGKTLKDQATLSRIMLTQTGQPSRPEEPVAKPLVRLQQTNRLTIVYYADTLDLLVYYPWQRLHNNGWRYEERPFQFYF